MSKAVWMMVLLSWVVIIAILTGSCGEYAQERRQIELEKDHLRRESEERRERFEQRGAHTLETSFTKHCSDMRLQNRKYYLDCMKCSSKVGGHNDFNNQFIWNIWNECMESKESASYVSAASAAAGGSSEAGKKNCRRNQEG